MSTQIGGTKMKTAKEYREKFTKQFKESDFKLEPNEKIVQCHEPYPPYWFISNHARLFSVYNDIKLIQMCFRKTGKKNKDDERPGYDWYYGYSRVFANKESNPKVPVHKLVAEHFLESEFKQNEPMEVHHIINRSSFIPNEGYAANSADNLQILPHSHHCRLNKLNKSPQEYDKAAQAAADKKGIPTIQLTQEQLMSMLVTGLTTGDAVIYLSSFNKDDGKLVGTMVKPINIELFNK